MDYRPYFPNIHFNQNNPDQVAPQQDSQSFTPQQYPFNLQFPLGSFSSQFFGDHSQFPSYQPSQISNLQHCSTKKKKQAKKKQQKAKDPDSQSQQNERNRNWSIEEDEILCKAWLRVSEDEITGSDQPRLRFWIRGLNEFNAILGRDSERVESGLMNRWSVLQGRLNKYSGFVQMVKRNLTSGFSEVDSIGQVNKLYKKDQGHDFKWYDCWLVLKDSSKWYMYTEELKEKKLKNAQKKRAASIDLDEFENSLNPSTPGTTATSVNLADDEIPPNNPSDILERPIGRKAAKNLRRNKSIDSAKAINLFAEEFGNLIKDQKEISEKEIEMTNERERMKIEGKQERERMKIEAKKEQDRMRFEKNL